MKDVVVLLLAGGDGGRFWPLGDKHSLIFQEKPLAFYTISQFRKFGFHNIVIVANKENELIFSKLSHEFPDLSISIIQQTDLHGQAGAIISAAKYINGKKLLVVNGADIYEDLLISSVSGEIQNNPDGIISGIKQNAYFLGGYLKIFNEKVVGVVEKPLPEEIPSHIVKLVFDYFKDASLLLNAISKVTSSNDDIFERAIDYLLKKGLNFKFLQYKGFWGSLKYPWHVLNIASYYLNKLTGQKIKKAFIHKTAVISGDVFIEDGVKILENTKIVGPVYIGRGTIIGQNCLVRESMIGANCVIGFATEIARSYIGDNCWFHTNYIGDSVISSNVALGAGSVLANYKLNEGMIKSYVGDQKIDTGKVKLGSIIGAGARLGVNVSIMPGVKIGRHCFVGPGVVLDRDLADDKSCKVITSKYEIKKNEFKLSSDSRKSTFNNLKLS